MPSPRTTQDALDILRRRYVGTNEDRSAALDEARVGAQVARAIYALRHEAGLSQKGLAQLVGTTQSVISRLEDDDYEGHSVKMLHRIARALNARLTVSMVRETPTPYRAGRGKGKSRADRGR